MLIEAAAAIVDQLVLLIVLGQIILLDLVIDPELGVDLSVILLLLVIIEEVKVKVRIKN